MNKRALKNTALAFANATTTSGPRGVAAGMAAAHWLWSIVERDAARKLEHRVSMQYWQSQETQ